MQTVKEKSCVQYKKWHTLYTSYTYFLFQSIRFDCLKFWHPCSPFGSLCLVYLWLHMQVFRCLAYIYFSFHLLVVRLERRRHGQFNYVIEGDPWHSYSKSKATRTREVKVNLFYQITFSFMLKMPRSMARNHVCAFKHINSIIMTIDLYLLA